MQPLQYVSQHPVANLHLSTHMGTPNDNNHAATPMRRSVTTDSTNAKHYAHRQNHALQNTEEEPILRPERPQPQPPHTHEVPFIAACSHFTQEFTRNFVLRLPPQHKRHHFPSSPLPFLTTSLRHHFPRSPLPFVTTLCHSLLFFCDVLLCDVKSHTALHQCQFSKFLFVRNTEVLLPNFL